MRIVAASMNYANSPREELIGKVIPMLAEATKAAEAEGVVLALENHIDFTSREVLRIIEAVGSGPPPGQLRHRQLPAPVRPGGHGSTRLAPYTVSTHTKDIATRRKGGSPVRQLHLVAGVRGRRGRHRHARGGQSAARRRF